MNTGTLTLNKKTAGANLRPTAPAKKAAAKNGLQGQGSNLRHRGYEPRALPTELPCYGRSCGGLLRLRRFAEHVGAQQLQIHHPRGWNSVFTPLGYGLRRNIAYPRDLIGPSKLINNVRIAHVAIKAYFKQTSQAHFNMVRICF